MNNKRIFALSLLGLFAFVFALNLVIAADPLTYINADSWIAGQGLGQTLSKILFTLLVFMAVFAIFDKIPLFNNKKWLAWPFSIIVAFLSMAWVTPDEIYGIMISYSAMGFVISAAIPFIILVVFTFSIATSDEREPGKTLAMKAVAWLMWFAFFVFIAWKAIATYASGTGNWAYIVVAILLAIILFSFGMIFRFLHGIKRTEEKRASDEVTAEAVTEQARLAAAGRAKTAIAVASQEEIERYGKGR